jgi:hypothetical protein
MDNKNWVKNEFKNMRIFDGRIITRVSKVVKNLLDSPSETIPKASRSTSSAKATYRLLSNVKLTKKLILESHKKKTIQRVVEKERLDKKISEQKVVLAIQDTTELDYSTLICTEGLGPYGSKEKSKGLIVHSTLAVSTDGVPYGLLDQDVWARKPEERGKSKNCRKLPIEKKESNKWLKSMDESSEGVPDEIRLVNVCDRDADLYEFLHKGVSEGKSFVVRAKHNRLIKEIDKKLFKRLENLPVCGEAIIEIPRDSRSKLPLRKVTFNVKFGAVTIVTPDYLPEKYEKDKGLRLNVVVVEEIDPPHNKKPIKWILFTNIEINTLEEALETVKWYKQRWKIERFFYVLKSGCKIEELQFENANQLIKALALKSIVAYRILWLAYQSRETPDISCEVILSPNEWQILDCITNKKTTSREKSPTLKEASVMIAKLGGFLARKGDGDPGVKVLWKGINEFTTVMKYLDITRNVMGK